MHRSLDEAHPFSLAGSSHHYAADRLIRITHLRIDVRLDFATRSVRGTTLTTLEATAATKLLEFDAIDLEVSKVKVNDVDATFHNDGRKLTITLKKALPAGASAVVRVDYRAKPTRGLYFIQESKGPQPRRTEAWTQGQDEDSPYWFPCLNAPAQKAATEVVATVPKAMTVLSNGRCVSDTVKGELRTTHYSLDAPHSAYLVTLVVGTFEEHRENAGAVGLRTLFPPGRKADALRCVARTPAMMKFFEEFSGRPYAWGAYAQVFVQDFIFGGMENTSATTLTDTVLHDEKAHADFSAEPLIAHELAHQWFGDLLTCRDWSHGWLNEGFATYSETLWKEHADGEDEADFHRMQDLDAYFDEAASRYQRAIVEKKFNEPIELFDSHLYEKGSLVLHELRQRLGDAAFRNVIRAYVQRHQGGAVETVDLARTVEDVTGQNLDRFFDQYVHRAGHAALKVAVQYDAKEKHVRVAVSQTAAGDPYALTLPVHVHAAGKDLERRFSISDKEHVFFIPCESPPTRVVVDARRDLLASLEVEKTPALWREELATAAHSVSRREAARALKKDATPATIEALTRSVMKEKEFYAVRAAAAASLAAIRSESARRALVGAMKVKHPKARRAVMAALGAFEGAEDVADALSQSLGTRDASYFVEAEAAKSLGRIRLASARKRLLEVLARPSFADVVACGALDGLAELRSKDVWSTLVEWTKPAHSMQARSTAVRALARLAPHLESQQLAVNVLGPLVRDDNFRVQMAVIGAVESLGDARLLPALDGTPFLDGRARRAAKVAAAAIRSKAGAPKELAALRSELDALKAEVRTLKEERQRGKGKSAK